MSVSSMSKNVCIVNGERVIDAVVEPGTTAADLLNQAKLNPGEFWLTNREGLPFGDEQEMWEVKDGSKIYAARRSNVAL